MILTGISNWQTEKGVTSRHPAIVLSHPNPINGNIEVAQISHNLLHGTPRQIVRHFYQGAAAMPNGDVRLGTPKQVRQDKAAPFLNKADGKSFPLVTGDNMKNLRAAIGGAILPPGRHSVTYYLIMQRGTKIGILPHRAR